MSKYMKKPIVIEAIQWTKENDVELEHWLSKEKSVELEIDDHLYVAGVGTPYISKIQIKTLEGTMEASYGDYIIKGINGEIYPCKPDIFEKTYEQPKQYVDELKLVEKKLKSLDLLMQELDCKDFAELRKYARCGYEKLNSFKGSKEFKIEIPESSLMDYNPVKHYLKWEDLEFSFKDKYMKVKLNGNIYILRYTRNALMEFPVAYLEFDNTEITIIDCKKQFFNDLHLERVEE